MSPEEYAREMLCSFDAPIEGAYYADLMNQAQSENRICAVPHDPNAQVFTWWDLGIDDATAIWFVQRVGRELHAIDYQEFTGKGLPDILPYLRGALKGYEHHGHYNYALHVYPHDIKARELGTGKSRFEVVNALLPNSEAAFVAPGLRVEDGIDASRSTIKMTYFDAEKCAGGISALRNYHRSKAGKPKHNWASHGADAWRTGSVALNQTIGYMSSNNVTMFGKRLRRRIRGIV
jgi:hypothetical protein